MCLAEPGRVVSIDGSTARVVTIGGPIDVSLALLGPRLDDVERGDWVVVCAGVVLLVIPDADVSALLDERRFLGEASDARLESIGTSGECVPTETSRS